MLDSDVQLLLSQKQVWHGKEAKVDVEPDTETETEADAGVGAEVEAERT